MNSKTLLGIDLPFPNRFIRVLFQSTIALQRQKTKPRTISKA